MRIYKEFYVEDMLELLEKAHENGHVSSELVDSDLASVLYYHLESLNDDIDEDEIYDFIRFEMQVMTSEEVLENYDIDIEEEENEHDTIEDYIHYHSTYIGNYEVNGTLYHVFTQF